MRETTDANGVGLIDGTFQASATDVSIGPSGPHGLAYVRTWLNDGWRDSISDGISGSTSNPVVSVGGESDSFTLSGGTYTSDQGSGATLTVSGATYTYTSRSGVVAQFADAATYGTMTRALSNIAWITSLTCPDGNVLTFNYKTDTVYWGTFSAQIVRLRSVSNSAGYMLHIDYVSNVVAPASYYTWSQVAMVTAINTQVESCSPSADTCSLSHPWPHATYGTTGAYSLATPTSRTDPVGRTTQYTYNSSGVLTAIRRPGASSDDVTIGYDSSGRVQTIGKIGATWTYSYATTAPQRQTTTIVNPDSSYHTLVADTSITEPVSNTNEVGNTTGYLFNVQGRLAQLSYPAGNSTSYTYDSRGNVTTITQIPAPLSGLSSTATTAQFDATCSNMRTCNQPQWTRDALLAQTDNTYDATTGLVTKVTAPAPTTGAVRPEVRSSYTTIGGVAMLTGTSLCRTTSSCAGGADEVKTTVGYNANLLPTTITTGAGDLSLTATTNTAYDDVGNIASVDGPLSGTADTTYYRYNADRRPVGAVSPDPDGAGPLKRRATRTSFAADGQVNQVEAGTVNGTSDADWAAFASLQQVSTGYDGYGRAISTTVAAGGTTYAVSQQSYDLLGRPLCSALRMNSAVFGSLPSDACTLGTTGSAGPDRITRTTYDAASHVLTSTAGYGTSSASIRSTLTYTINGQVASAKDANGNLTSYVYDGLKRPSVTYFPSTTTGAGTSSTTDYEQLSYDANGHVTSRRLRDGSSITFAYDNLGRMTTQTRPAIGYNTALSYAYDNLGRPTGLTGNWSGTNGYVYDALGRVLSESNPWLGTTSWQYDVAGRRTRLTWNDGFYVTYDYDVSDEMTAIRENGGTALVSFAYDNLGRRTSLSRLNGVTTTYSYDAASRLTSLAQDLNGTAGDVTIGLGYTAGGQIGTRTSSNDLYAWGGAVSVSRAYSTNGLNQYTASGTTSLGYDARGNLATSGSTSYGYNGVNQLVTAPSELMVYDPTDRLFYSQAEAALFRYDGGLILTEHDATYGTVRRRYVYGPGTDEPLVWYEGSGTSDRRFMVADERGSVIAVTDGSGNAISINAYDEYGIPSATVPANQGRFGYTGQAWLPSLGLWYYKARMYSPTLGRFMQTDPIGYGDGLNWYNYVGGDPVNWTDPSGLLCSGVGVEGEGLSEAACKAAHGTFTPDVVVNGRTCFSTNGCYTSIDKSDLSQVHITLSNGLSFNAYPGDIVAAVSPNPKRCSPAAVAALQRLKAASRHLSSQGSDVQRVGISLILAELIFPPLEVSGGTVLSVGAIVKGVSGVGSLTADVGLAGETGDRRAYAAVVVDALGGGLGVAVPNGGETVNAFIDAINESAAGTAEQDTNTDEVSCPTQ